MPGLGATLILVLLAVPSLTTAQVITVDYDHRHLHEGWSPPPAGFHEGAVNATFTGSVEIDTAFAQPGLIRVDATTWQYEFGWDATDSLSFFFHDREERLHEVRTRPGWPPFIPGEQTVPVISLEVDPAALWSPATGIYVWGDGDEPNWDQRGEFWERQATLRWYDVDGSLQHDRPIGLRINGAWNRHLAQKSLRLYFDHHGAPTTIVDDFFGSAPYTHERLILRASSSRPTFFLRDVLATTIFAAAGHERSRWTPVELFLSDEYWGLYHLRERPDDEWAELTLGLSGDYIMVKDNEAVHGDIQIWDDFLDWVGAASDPETNTFYLDLTAELDLVSYLDWVLIECWSASSDNGGTGNVINIKPAGGRWRFVMYDQDGSFGSSNYHHDFFQFFASASQAEFDQRHPPVFYPPYEALCRVFFDLWRQSMSNPRCRRLARQRWEGLNEQLFTYGFNAALLDSMVALQVDAAARHQERWDWTNSLPAAASTIKSIIAARRSIADTQFDAFMNEWMDPVELDEFTVSGPRDAVQLAWHSEREIDCQGWLVERRQGEEQPWQCITSPLIDAVGSPDQPADYATIDTTLPDDGHWQYRLSHRTGEDEVVVHPWVESWGVPTALPGLVINEFLASNATVNADETGAFEDWVELYNAGSATVDLAGVHLTDDLAEPLKWPLPAGLVLGAGEYLLIWCDDDPDDGPLHATFKLAAAGESIGLFQAVGDHAVLVDAYTFTAQVTDVSEGRFPDGGAEWVRFPTPTPGSPNLVTGIEESPRAPLLIAAWPNPFNPTCRLSVNISNPGLIHLSIHDLTGRRVRLLRHGPEPAGARTFVFDGCDDRGASLPSGVYHAVLRAGAERATVKLTLVQ